MVKLIKEGDALFKDEKFDQAIRKYLDVFQYTNNAPVTSFKLSKLYSIKKDSYNTYKHIVKAIQSGFNDFNKIMNDKNLIFLRSLPEFKTLASNNFDVPIVETNISTPRNNLDTFISKIFPTKQNPLMVKLIKEGDGLFKVGEINQAIRKYHTALQYTDKAPQTNFKLSQLYSIKKDGSNSFKHMVLAIKSGFNDFDKIQSNKNLVFLRNLPEFKTLASNNFNLQIDNTNASSPINKYDKLERLYELYKKGALTKDEFENEKKKLLIN